jgi:hypothetical protein
MFPRQGVNMFVERVDIRIESPSGPNEVAEVLRQLCVGSPFAVRSVTSTWTGAHDCTFETKREGLAVGYSSVIELQFRIHRFYDMVSIDCATNARAVPKLELVG